MQGWCLSVLGRLEVTLVEKMRLGKELAVVMGLKLEHLRFEVAVV